MNSKLFLLDGATGTERNRRGVDTGLPLWSANALATDAGLNVLRQVHLDYLNAGADIITTNTFRTNRRVLAGKGHSACELTKGAVATTLEAVAEFGDPAQVAGSLASLEDRYRPFALMVAPEQPVAASELGLSSRDNAILESRRFRQKLQWCPPFEVDGRACNWRIQDLHLPYTAYRDAHYANLSLYISFLLGDS
ncbi:MAG: homocysteine S-methyltransferase family protein [Pirellula sp.]